MIDATPEQIVAFMTGQKMTENRILREAAAEIEQLNEQCDIFVRRVEQIRRERESDWLALKAERLTGLLKEYQEHAEPYWKAEIERLTAVCKDKTVLLRDAYAEIDLLRAELEQMREDWNWYKWQEKAARALEPKP